MLAPSSPSLQENYTLWYSQPAETWATEALPIGNGRLGGMIFGGVERDRVQFNEITLWTGGPGEFPGYRQGNLEGHTCRIREIQEAVSRGDDVEARRLIAGHLYGTPQAFGAYQPFGDVVVNFAGHDGEVTGYRRELDLSRGVVRVQYAQDGHQFTREYFCSHPHQVLVVRYRAEKPALINGEIALTTPHVGAVLQAPGNAIELNGKLESNQLAYQAVLQARALGGTVEPSPCGRMLIARDCTELVLILTAGTAYAPVYPHFTGTDYVAQNTRNLAAAESRTWAELFTSAPIPTTP